MAKVVDWNGREIDFDAAVALMDDDIREELHEELSPCTAQRFLTRISNNIMRTMVKNLRSEIKI